MLQVHHIVPFSTAPDLELEPSNLITLCMGEFDCHLRLGHGGSFRHYNPLVVEDATEFREAEVHRRTALIKEARARRLD
jgi:5-methylcytosine-specific restriction endonuclease McrA